MYEVLADRPAADGCGPNMPQIGPRAESLRQQIFEHVRATGRAARADVTRALGISPGTVTTLTADLIAAGLLREVEHTPREAGRGRPPVALEVVPHSHHVIGLKLAEDRHSAVLTDFAGNILCDVAMPVTNSRKSAQTMLNEVEKLLTLLMARSDQTLADVSAVGIGLSGIVDNQTGTVPWSPLLKERDVPLAVMFTARFGMQVSLDNDANMLTLAELWFGAGRSLPDFAVVTIEHGVGMGLVLNNRLFRGSRGMGLELGHIKVQLDGALCRCGQRGCLEAYLADYALLREAGTALDAAVSGPAQSLETLYAEAKAGNIAARSIFRRAGRYLSVGLANVIQLFDPALIILTGERMQYDYLYEEEVLREMRAMTLTEGRTPCEVTSHAWGDLVWARGATALALAAVTAAVVNT
jgi:predicted NBD/HSP70 family sugar kinase